MKIIFIVFCVSDSFRRPQHFLRIAQLVRAHRYVLLLHGVGDGTRIPEIHLVEEVSHLIPDGENAWKNLPFRRQPIISTYVVCVFSVAIRVHFHPSVPAVVRRMQLPEKLYDLDRIARRYVSVPVLRLLQDQIHQGR